MIMLGSPVYSWNKKLYEYVHIRGGVVELVKFYG